MRDVYGMRNASLHERIERRTDKSGGAEACWPFVGALNDRGYGIICIGHQKMRRAHRVAYEVHVGPLRDDQVVMHLCDNPRCVNPAHLRAGTQRENMEDARAKGRAQSIAPPTPRLSHDQVRAIREDVRPYRTIAREYGITHGYVANLKSRHSRREVA